MSVLNLAVFLWDLKIWPHISKLSCFCSLSLFMTKHSQHGTFFLFSSKSLSNSPSISRYPLFISLHGWQDKTHEKTPEEQNTTRVNGESLQSRERLNINIFNKRLCAVICFTLHSFFSRNITTSILSIKTASSCLWIPPRVLFRSDLITHNNTTPPPSPSVTPGKH